MVWMIRGKGTGKVSASIKLLVNKESSLTIVNQISLIISIILIMMEKNDLENKIRLAPGCS